MTYLHASDERQGAIAEAMSEISAGELGRRRPVHRARNGYESGGTRRIDHQSFRPQAARAPSATRTRDLLLRRSFRPTPLPANVQVGTCVVGLSVPVNDRHGGHVLVRIWHAPASRAGRLSMRTTGSSVDGDHGRRYGACRGRLRPSDVGSVAAQSCCTFGTLTLKCQQAGILRTISLGSSPATPAPTVLPLV